MRLQSGSLVIVATCACFLYDRVLAAAVSCMSRDAVCEASSCRFVR